MKRDMDLVRKLMFKIEDECGPREILELHMDGVDDDTVTAHLAIMGEAGLLHPVVENGVPRAMGLRWAGYEFLDTIREPEAWQTIKGRLGKVISYVSLSVIQGVALEYAKERVRALGFPVP